MATTGEKMHYGGEGAMLRAGTIRNELVGTWKVNDSVNMATSSYTRF